MGHESQHDLAESSVRLSLRCQPGLRFYLEAWLWKNPLPSSHSWQNSLSCSCSTEGLSFLWVVCWTLSIKRSLKAPCYLGFLNVVACLLKAVMGIKESGKMGVLHLMQHNQIIMSWVVAFFHFCSKKNILVSNRPLPPTEWEDSKMRRRGIEYKSVALIYWNSHKWAVKY